jgi:UDP-N-acetylglucosamine acyltransferase
MPQIHPTAVIEGDVALAEDVVVGPYCVLTGPVTVGAETTLVGNVYLQGPITLGARNVVYPFTCLGFAPQHLKFDPATHGAGLVIGDGNTFREHVTVHRAFATEPTRIGDANLFMAGSHVGHDCRVANACILTNAVLLGGHVDLADRTIVGGGTVIQQFARVGRGAMISGRCGISLDVPPYALITGVNLWASVNLIGMRRAGIAREDIDDARWVHRVVCRDGHSPKRALEILRERGERPIVAEYVRFLESCRRGYCSGRVKERHEPAMAP